MSIARTQYNVFQQLTSVKAVRVSNLAGVYLNGLLNNGVGATLTASGVGALVIDGVTLEQNDRVLLVAQTNSNENGVYVVTNPGGAAAVWVLTRSADQQSIEQMKEGQFIPVSAGSSNAGAVYVLVSPLPAHLGVDALVVKASYNALSLKVRAQKANYAGGAATAVLADASLTAASVVVASIESSANAVEVQKVTPGAGNLTVLMSGDPGASVISYLAISAAQ